MASLMVTALAVGCGEVHFGPAAFTPTNVELIYSAQEDITLVRWRVAGSPLSQTRFEMLGHDGYERIDFSKSVFAGGLESCGDGHGTCAQYVVRGVYTVASDRRPVQAVHDTFGALPGGFPTSRTVPVTLSFDSFFSPKNDMVNLTIRDAVAASGSYTFPRPYERTMWPTSGLCVGDGPPAGVTFSPVDDSLRFPPATPLTTDGTYCVATRPVPADGGDATMVQLRIATGPEVVTARQVFGPPVERSPIIYQLIVDLDIPVPDRCADVLQKIETLTQRYMSAGDVPVRKLPTINLAATEASQCAQSTGRIVQAADISQMVKQAAQSFPGIHQQAHILYFNNLDAPLPSSVSMSLQSLFDALKVPPPGYDLQPLSWLFAPPLTGYAAIQVMDWRFFSAWETADEMFEMNLAQYRNESLPYTTQFHDPSEPVALLSGEDAATYDGKPIKICRSSTAVQAVGVVPVLHVINQPSWTISPADPPAYLVTLRNQVVGAASGFIEQSAIVDYQICTRYCDDHPYVNQAGAGETSWSSAFQCTSDDY